MGKRKLINTIKKFVENHSEDTVTMSDLNAESSPMVSSTGDDIVQLVERLYLDKVETVVYLKDNEIDTIFLEYGKLSEDTLQEIVNLIELELDVSLELNDEEN